MPNYNQILAGYWKVRTLFEPTRELLLLKQGLQRLHNILGHLPFYFKIYFNLIYNVIIMCIIFVIFSETFYNKRTIKHLCQLDQLFFFIITQ